MPTATPTPAPQLRLSKDRSTICAGAWHDVRKNYQYYSADAGGFRERTYPDVHMAMLVATVTDDGGKPLGDKEVQFSWDMPGPAPAENRTARTNNSGEARVYVLSGDEPSKAYDETGKLLYSKPVIVKATCEGKVKETPLDVLVPSIQWQYRNEQDSYVPWKGEIFGLYSPQSGKRNIPLRIVLKFGDLPVVGHPISWAMDTVYDKAGAPVSPSAIEYTTYGRLSGPISTTGGDGSATATFYPGYRFGQLFFAFTDSAIYTRDGGSSTMSAASSRLSQRAGFSAQTSGRRVKRGVYATINSREYTWVKGKGAGNADGTPSYKLLYSYPAPSGEEDDELLKPTLDYARSIMVEAKRSKTGLRGQMPNIYALGPYPQDGKWWFSQAVGNDSESYGTHLADVKVTKTVYDPRLKKNKTVTYYYSGAFDIVLTDVPIFKDLRPRQKKTTIGKDKKPHTVTIILNQGVPAFGIHVKAMRDNGIVAWHRWAGESASTSENEMHCIDPATPFLKNYLKFQISDFVKKGGGTGSKTNGYPSEPKDSKSSFRISPSQQDEVKKRLNNKFSVPNQQQDNITP